MAILSGIYEPYYYIEIGEAIALFIYGIILLASIGLYIMQSIAVMKMAKKRNIKNGWLAWIPVASDYMFGKVSEPTGKGKKTGITLLVLNIVTGVVSIIFTIIMIAFIMAMEFSQTSSMEFFGAGGIALLTAFIIGIVVILGVSIAYTVVKFIAYYRICQNFGGESGIGFFIGILVTTLLDIGIVPPILMLVLASKTPADAGEVPQAAAVAPQAVAVAPQAVAVAPQAAAVAPQAAAVAPQIAAVAPQIAAVAAKPEEAQMAAPEISAPEAQEVPQAEEKAEGTDEE